MGLPLVFVEGGAETLVRFFQAGAAALQTGAVRVALPQTLLEHADFAIAQSTTTTRSGSRKHGRPRQTVP
jgi:hypothetical protein